MFGSSRAKILLAFLSIGCGACGSNHSNSKGQEIDEPVFGLSEPGDDALSTTESPYSNCTGAGDQRNRSLLESVVDRANEVYFEPGVTCQFHDNGALKSVSSTPGSAESPSSLVTMSRICVDGDLCTAPEWPIFILARVEFDAQGRIAAIDLGDDEMSQISVKDKEGNICVMRPLGKNLLFYPSMRWKGGLAANDLTTSYHPTTGASHEVLFKDNTEVLFFESGSVKKVTLGAMYVLPKVDGSEQEYAAGSVVEFNESGLVIR